MQELRFSDGKGIESPFLIRLKKFQLGANLYRLGGYLKSVVLYLHHNISGFTVSKVAPPHLMIHANSGAVLEHEGLLREIVGSAGFADIEEQSQKSAYFDNEFPSRKAFPPWPWVGAVVGMAAFGWGRWYILCKRTTSERIGVLAFISAIGGIILVLCSAYFFHGVSP